jgi:hypothetical protein
MMQIQPTLSIDAIAARIGNDAVQILLLQAQVSALTAENADLKVRLNNADAPPEEPPAATTP